MKTNLFTGLGFSILAFASFGQLRQNGVQQGSINTTNPVVPSQLHQVSNRASIGNRPTNMLGHRAPCVDTLLFEDFQSETIPGSWINLDIDGNTDANGRPQDWYITADLQTTTPGDTNYVATSSSWFTPLGTANNVLILDAVQPCASTVLRWASAPFEGPTYMDGYEVRISTTGTNIADFTTTLFTAAESVNGTATPSAGTVHTNYNGNNGVLQNWEVNLGAYDNQTVYIAFFHDSNDDNLIMVDNIFIGVVVDYDISVNSFITDPYYSTPITQVSPRTFTTDIALTSGAPVTSPTANVEVFQGATSVYTNSPSAPSLTAGNSVSLTTSGFTPAAVESYTAIVNASAVESDPNISNNSDTLTFVVSDSVFATENGVVNGSLGIGAGTAGFLGNQYNVEVTDDLTSITFALNTPTLGDTVYCAVYDMIGSTPNQIIATTDIMVVPSATSAEYTLSILGGGVSLTPGSYIVGIQESVANNVSVATNSDYFQPDMSWVFFNGSWGNNEDYGFNNTYYIRANFGCPVITADFSSDANDLFVSFSDSSVNVDAWSWDFGDGNTSTMQNPNHTYATGGTYTVCLIAYSNCDSDTICTQVTVSNCTDPVASYTETPSAGGVVDFTNTSTSTATTTYFWDFGDGNTSTNENPTNTYATNGTYTVCLTVTDSCGVDSICNSVVVNTIGLGENNLIDLISVYPVPAQDQLTVSNLTKNQNFKLELINNLGQVVRVIQSNGMGTVQFDLNSVADGYYQLRLSENQLFGTRPLVIKR